MAHTTTCSAKAYYVDDTPLITYIDFNFINTSLSRYHRWQLWDTRTSCGHHWSIRWSTESRGCYCCKTKPGVLTYHTFNFFFTIIKEIWIFISLNSCCLCFIVLQEDMLGGCSVTDMCLFVLMLQTVDNPITSDKSDTSERSWLCSFLEHQMMPIIL